MQAAKFTARCRVNLRIHSNTWYPNLDASHPSCGGDHAINTCQVYVMMPGKWTVCGITFFLSGVLHWVEIDERMHSGTNRPHSSQTTALCLLLVCIIMHECLYPHAHIYKTVKETVGIRQIPDKFGQRRIDNVNFSDNFPRTNKYRPTLVVSKIYVLFAKNTLMPEIVNSNRPRRAKELR